MKLPSLFDPPRGSPRRWPARCHPPRRIVPRLEELEDRVALTPFTMTSPTSKGALPAEVTPVGGIVLDLVGTNGARVVAELPASSLFVGTFDSGSPREFRGNPGTIGIQKGLSPDILRALGGGLSQVAVRLTVFDGDSARGNFDFDANELLLDGVPFENFSAVPTQETSADGQTALSNNSAGGFRNSRLDTGFFYSQDTAVLDKVFAALVATHEVKYQFQDKTPFDNFLDFTQGVEGSVLEVQQPPPVVSGPSTGGQASGPSVHPDTASGTVAPSTGASSLPASAAPNSLAPAVAPAAPPGAVGVAPTLTSSQQLFALLDSSRNTSAPTGLRFDPTSPPSAGAIGPSLVTTMLLAQSGGTGRSLSGGGGEEPELWVVRKVSPRVAEASSVVVTGIRQAAGATLRLARWSAYAFNQALLSAPAEAVRIWLARGVGLLARPPGPGVVSVPRGPPALAEAPASKKRAIQTTLLLLAALIVQRSGGRARARRRRRQRRERAPGGVSLMP